MEKKNKCLTILKTLLSNIWYVIVLITVVAVIFLMIANWGDVLSVVERFLTVIMPFILGTFFACLVNPLVRLIEKGLDHIHKLKKQRVKKVLSVLFAYVIVGGFISAIIIYIYPQVKGSMSELGKSVQNGYQYMITHEQEINDKIPFIDLSGAIDYIKDTLYDRLMNYGSDLFPYVYQISSSVLSTTYNVLMGLVISVYIVLDTGKMKYSMKKVIYAISPKKREAKIWNTLKECFHIFNGFLIGKLIDSLIIGVICLILMLVLRMPYALLVSLVIAITNMIPYFGPIFGTIPVVIVYLFIDIRMAIMFTVMILILQQFDGLYLGPRILGDQTGIKPLWVIFGITVGGAYFGVMGMFLGVPTVAVLMYLVNLLLDKKLKKKEIRSF